MLSPYRIPQNSNKKRQKISNTNLVDFSNREHDLKRRQTTSKNLKMTSKEPITNKRSHLKSGDLSKGSILLEQTFSSAVNGWNHRNWKNSKVQNEVTQTIENYNKNHTEHN